MKLVSEMWAFDTGLGNAARMCYAALSLILCASAFCLVQVHVWHMSR